MVKIPFHFKPKSTVCLLAAAFITTLLLYGCSGGDRETSATSPLASMAATSGLLKLGAAGMTTELIAGMDLWVNLPAGVTVDADAKSGEIASGAITVSGAAAEGGNSLVTAKYVPSAAGAPAKLHIVLINAAGFHPGEFATLRFNLSAGATFPALNEFAVASFSAKGLNNSTLSGITAAPLSVVGTGNAAASKQTKAQLVVTGDQNFLNISVDTPTKNTSQTITGTLFPGDHLSITTNTAAIVSPAVITGGTWSAQVSGLVEGPNIIAVTELDPADAIVASVSATIYLDTKAPDLNVDASLGTKYFFKAIGGTVDDPPYHIVALDVKCDAAIVEMATVAVPNWSAMISKLNYGDNVCHVTATDPAGNHSSKDVHIYYDNLAPELNIHVNDLVKYGTSQTITGTVESGIKPVISINGADYTGIISVNGPDWSCQVNGLAEGVNSITVSATDLYGNVSTRTVTITTVVASGSFSGNYLPTVADALKALRIAVGFYQPTLEELLYGDLYDDGLIDLSDAILILKKVVGLY